MSRKRWEASWDCPTSRSYPATAYRWFPRRPVREKNTIVFLPELRKKGTGAPNKHLDFIEEAGAQGYILASGIKDIGRAVYDIAKGKIQTKPLDDNPVILEALRKII